MKTKAFISHSQKDTASYSALCLALDHAGVSRWDVSNLSIGTALADGLRQAICECDVCILLATARSLQSRWCLAEIGAFWGAGKKVVIYLADPGVSETDFPPQFSGNLWTADIVKLIEAVKAVDSGRIRATENGFHATLGTVEIKVAFGRIEQLAVSIEDALIVLPANEFFDDDCIHDARSALGAFMNCHFKEGVRNVQELVKAALLNQPSQAIEKRPGEVATSYDVGKCVFLNRPLGSQFRIALVSVTTQRADAGLCANPAYICEALNEVQGVMANNRLARVVMPLLGSGHGGLRSEASLACLLIAFGHLGRTAGSKFRQVTIVVFQSKQDSPPEISELRVRKVLEFASDLFAV